LEHRHHLHIEAEKKIPIYYEGQAVKNLDQKLEDYKLETSTLQKNYENAKRNNNVEAAELLNKRKLELDELIVNSENNNVSESSSNKIKNYTLVDLFCGTGAFSYAFHKTNKVETIFANDMLDSSEEIFNLNNTTKLTKKSLIDIKDQDIPKSQILTAGFPCQPFSIAGMQKGFDDERSNVFWKILSILKHNSPEIVILENVKNLQSHDDGKTFKIIILIFDFFILIIKIYEFNQFFWTF
jgi:hypothetical protein